MDEEKRMIHNNLQKSAADVSSQLAVVASTNSELEKQKEVSMQTCTRPSTVH